MLNINITPQELIFELNKYVIGQYKAKKIISIAIRNRWRKLQLSKKNKLEIIPKNILLIGDTGIGKTTIIKCLANILDVPFIKVEATSFTQIGYIGNNVNSIIKNLLYFTYNKIKKNIEKKNLLTATKISEIKIFNILINKIKKNKNILFKIIKKDFFYKYNILNINDYSKLINLNIIKKKIHKDLFNNKLDNLKIYFNYNNNNRTKISIKLIKIFLLKNILLKINKKQNINKIAIKYVEDHGIIFIDEIDKICTININNISDGNTIGVQRDLLPLLDGCEINTKYGKVKTNNILFIAAGCFKQYSINNLLPELKGRLPIKIKLSNLSIKDLTDILIKNDNSLIKQYKELLKIDNIRLFFTLEAIKYIAVLAYNINLNNENLGARQLFSIIETIIEDISFDIIKYKNKTIIINSQYIKNKNILLDYNINNYYNNYII